MLLEWWNDVVQWFSSEEGWAVLTGLILPFVAILVAGLLAGLITRGSMKRFIAHQDRLAKSAAVAALLASARRAAVWSTLTAQEKDHVEHQSSEAEVRLRLLPVTGSGLAADWAAHYLDTMKKSSANYGFQAEQDLADLQAGLIGWQAKPSRAKKLFAHDLAAWKYDDSIPEDELLTKQRDWAAQQPADVLQGG